MDNINTHTIGIKNTSITVDIIILDLLSIKLSGKPYKDNMFWVNRYIRKNFVLKNKDNDSHSIKKRILIDIVPRKTRRDYLSLKKDGVISN